MTLNSNQKLDPSFLAGFIDAEGCLMITPSKIKDLIINWRVQTTFKINLHSKNLPLLKEIQSFFGGVGTIRIESNRDVVSYIIQDMKSIKNILIPHFENNPLQTLKLIINYGNNVNY